MSPDDESKPEYPEGLLAVRRQCLSPNRSNCYKGAKQQHEWTKEAVSTSDVTSGLRFMYEAMNGLR